MPARSLTLKFVRQALWVWYRGERFWGFQWQADRRSVQSALEEALSPLGVTARPMPAGRTDCGVHARMQVVTIKTPAELGDAEVLEGCRRSLRDDGGVALLRRTRDDFHAQWSAVGKHYRYRLNLHGGETPPHAWSVPLEPRLENARVDPGVLREVVGELATTADFSALHGRGSSRRPRTIGQAAVVDGPDGLTEVRLTGDSFGRHQVRILVGTAVLVAAGKLSRRDFAAALHEQRPVAGLRAPAHGLILWEVLYPEELDPFSPADRAAALNVPRSAPFGEGELG